MSRAFPESAPAEMLPPGSPPLPEPNVFTASDGYDHAYRLWRPEGVPRGLIVLVHGIQSHSGWYGYSSARLSEAGYAVAFLDRRGSGANPIARGDAAHADRLVNDVVQFASVLERSGLGGMPRVLSSISWGGKLAATVAARRPELFCGLALLTPGMCSRFGANAMQRTALRLAGAAGHGSRAVPIPLDDPALFTDVPGCREFIERDPLTLRRVTVRFLDASLRLDAEVRRQAAFVRCPTLLMLAGSDRIIDNLATQQLVASFGSPEKTLIECAGACHTLEFEPERDRYLDHYLGWLERTIRH